MHYPLLVWIAIGVWAFAVLWYCFVVLSAAYRAYKSRGDSLPWPIWALVVPALLLGGPIDIAIGQTLGTLLATFDPLHRITFSEQLSWTVRHRRGWRLAVARWFADNLIEPIAPGHVYSHSARASFGKAS